MTRVVLPWDSHGASMRHPRDVYIADPMGLPWCVHGSYLMLPWTFDGVVAFSRTFGYGTSMGLPWQIS